jgi:hypothetical protein
MLLFCYYILFFILTNLTTKSCTFFCFLTPKPHHHWRGFLNTPNIGQGSSVALLLNKARSGTCLLYLTRPAASPKYNFMDTANLKAYGKQPAHYFDSC